MDLPNIQELQEKYAKITNENRRTLVRLRNSKLIIGVTDRLDAAISSIELVSKIFVDTLVGRLNAKKAAIFYYRYQEQQPLQSSAVGKHGRSNLPLPGQTYYLYQQ